MFDKTGLEMFAGKTLEELKVWCVSVCLVWLVERLNLTAGVLCGSLPAELRRKVYGLSPEDELPAPIDWSRNGIVISPPGTGKGMAIFVEALAHYDQVYVLVPSVIQAHKLEESLDTLYHKYLGGCATSQRKSRGVITVITTGIFKMLVRDQESPLWTENSVLIVDEAQRIYDQDPQTEFMIGYMAQMGLTVMAVSATIAPGNLPNVLGEPGAPAPVYSLTKQMHPINIEVLREEKPDVLFGSLECLRKDVGKTTLIFCSSRSEVMRVASKIGEAEHLGHSVAVTGAHMVEQQLEKIERLQATDESVIVVATPGTMDSSVTVPGLSTVIIVDQRFRVDYNRHGVLERYTETLPINHIWQMVRRVGRQRRDNGTDQVIILSESAREDVLAEQPSFEPLQGCSPAMPIHDLLLEAVALDVRFQDVHSFMLSSFNDRHIHDCTSDLLEAGLIVRVDDPSDPDGFELTEIGALVQALPYDFHWSRMVAEASEELQDWLCMAASCGRLRSLVLKERAGVALGDLSPSEILHKLQVVVPYLQLETDARQSYAARALGLSFRATEQVETLFSLGMQALSANWKASELRLPSESEELQLLEYIVTKGIETKLYELFFPEITSRGVSEARKVGDDERARRFIVGKECTIDFSSFAVDGVVVIVARPTWFTARSGAHMSNLEDVTAVPATILREVVDAHAEKQGWFRATFEEAEGRNPLVAKDQYGDTLIPSRIDNEPVPGKEYWCSIDKGLTPYVTSVWVHYPTGG